MFKNPSGSGSDTDHEHNGNTNYRLRVTAGPEYDTDTHQIVPVNADKTLRIETEHAIIHLCVRIRDYTGESV
jgi:hypothetical protein